MQWNSRMLGHVDRSHDRDGDVQQEHDKFHVDRDRNGSRHRHGDERAWRGIVVSRCAQQVLASGQVVALTATAAEGSTFAGSEPAEGATEPGGCRSPYGGDRAVDRVLQQQQFSGGRSR